MAAASGEANPQSGQNEEAGKVFGEDEREGRKKKFRPFEAMRKFFKSGKKASKSKEDISVKSRSLHMIRGHEDSDDDGGFKKRLGSRSMSEDSVFQPEVKESKMDAIRKTAISMEGLNQDFQSELASKLKKRYSLHSSDDEGLSQSPIPPITTADFVMGGSLKPLPGTGKSTSKDSDISIDTDAEDDPFKTDWSKSVASVSKRKSSTQSLSDSGEMDLDLSAIGKETATLSNDAARHRISVKRSLVKRRPSGTRKNKEQKKSSTTLLPQVKEEATAKSDVHISPVNPEPLPPKSPISPVSPVSPKPLSPTPLSSKTDLFPKIEENLPEQKAADVVDNKNKNNAEKHKKNDESSASEYFKKPEEHKTVIAIGHVNEKDTNPHVDFNAGLKPHEDKPALKSMSLDRRMNYNLSDHTKQTDNMSLDRRIDYDISEHTKPTHNIGQIARQRPKSLHDSVAPATGTDNNNSSELSKTFNKMKRNSLKETGNDVAVDTSKDTGFYIVGSVKNKEKDIPFGARRPETKHEYTSFNEGKSAKQTETSATTQSKNMKTDLVKPAVSPTKPNITGYRLKKEPLKSQSLSDDKKENSSKPNIADNTKSVETDSKKENVKQTLSDSGKENVKQTFNISGKENVKQTFSNSGKEVNDLKGAENKNTKEPTSNYENVELNFESNSKKTEAKDIEKVPEKIVIISADETKKDESPKKRHNYDNVILTPNESTNKLATPREEYRLKRQARSRTLPEQPVSADLLTNKQSSRKDSLTQSFRAKEEGIKTDSVSEQPETKPLESKKIGSLSSSYSGGSEPSWMRMAKKRQGETKEKDVDTGKDKSTSKPLYTGGRLGSLSDSTKFTPKSVFTSGSTSEHSKEKDMPKVSESTSSKTSTKSSFRGANVSSEPQKDTKVTKSSTSGIGSLSSKDGKDMKNLDKKTDTKADDKSQISASSLAKSFESSLKSTPSTGRNMSLDAPKGWKGSSIKKKEVKIEIIEKTEPSKPSETNKPPLGRTTTAKKTEENAPLRDKTVPEKCVDRKSKVLDMVKNFQNLQVN